MRHSLETLSVQVKRQILVYDKFAKNKNCSTIFLSHLMDYISAQNMLCFRETVRHIQFYLQNGKL